MAETVMVPGSEPTGTGAGVADRVGDVFERARTVITAAAFQTADLVRNLGEQAKPDRVELEFGIGFSAKGNIIVAGSSADASLKVKLVYDGSATDTTEPSHGAPQS
ncbi:CU044_2847 family protein [Nocardia sp. CS682]|uniref:CU044_2847 family protein n=1 Tax=Nocardia sp. CS682 TaxID=1047172 RepID=UPI00107573BD|nr:CU044_2847 family protein [Nocardia sp. CS682]